MDVACLNQRVTDGAGRAVAHLPIMPCCLDRRLLEDMEDVGAGFRDRRADISASTLREVTARTNDMELARLLRRLGLDAGPDLNGPVLPRDVQQLSTSRHLHNGVGAERVLPYLGHRVTPNTSRIVFSIVAPYAAPVDQSPSFRSDHSIAPPFGMLRAFASASPYLGSVMTCQPGS